MGKVAFTCSGCKSPVYKYLSQLTRTDIVFCSIGCRNKNYYKITNKRPPNYKGPVKKTCKGCGDKYFIDRGREIKSRLYCSQVCSAKNIQRTPHTAKTKAKLSKIATEQNKKYKGKHLYKNADKILKMRSSWEVLYAHYLDKVGISWEYEPSFILSNSYVYTPDFKLDSGDIIEIKGYWWKDAKIKWDLFCKDYPHINKKVLMKEDLQKIGVI